MKVKLGDVCDKGSSNLKQSDVINQNGQYPVYGAAGLLGNIDSYHQDKPYVAVVKDGAGIGRVTLHPGYSSVIGTLQYLLPKENVLPEYLYYVTKHMHLEKYYTGATIPHIYFKDYKNEKFNLDAIEKQQRIVDILKKIENIIESRQQELQKLDDLIRARFVELFGEPGTNPMNWKETTIGEECFYIKDGPHKSLSDIGKENGGHPFISVRNIVDGYINFSNAKYISDEDYAAAIKKCHPEKGDMLYSKGGTTGIAKLIDVEEKFANWVHVAVLKFDKEKLNGVFFENMLNSTYCYEQSQRLTKGIANRDLVLSAMAQIKMYRPPLELQNQFADFVAQIDKSKLLSGCRLFYSWAPENRDKPKHVGVPQRKTKVLRGGRRQQ